MIPVFLDVAMPSTLIDAMEALIIENSTGLILLLVVQLLIASGVVIGIVLRKQPKEPTGSTTEAAQPTDEECDDRA